METYMKFMHFTAGWDDITKSVMLTLNIKCFWLMLLDTPWFLETGKKRCVVKHLKTEVQCYMTILHHCWIYLHLYIFACKFSKDI